MVDFSAETNRETPGALLVHKRPRMSANSNQHRDKNQKHATRIHPPRGGRLWLLVALCAAAVYLPTMAPGLLWGDSGDAQIRVLRGELRDPALLARTHVTYYAVAIALRDTVGLNPALAANLVSALAGIVTVANVGWLISLFVRRRTPIACGVALLLLSHTLWQLSTGAEVGTFSTMCLSLELVMVVKFARTRRLRWLALIGLVNGIGWSTHNFALLIWPAYALMAVMRWGAFPKPYARSLVVVAGMWVLGSLPLIVLTILDYRQGGDASVTIRSLLVGWYGPRVFNTNVTPRLILQQIAYVAYNFPTPLILLAIFGWWRIRSDQGRGIWWFLTVSGVVYFVFAARYRVPDQYTFLIHGYVFLILFAAVGIDHWLGRFRSKAMWASVVLLSLVAPLVYSRAPGLARRFADGSSVRPTRAIPYRDLLQWFLTPWRTGYDGAERYARETFEMLPPDALLIAGSTTRRPLDYLQGHEDLRKDVRMPLLNFRLASPDDLNGGFTAANALIERRLLFCTSNVRPYTPKWLVEAGYTFEPVNHVYRVNMPKSSVADR